jgi:YHYH protein/Secretion system C-terminal sorting domain
MKKNISTFFTLAFTATSIFAQTNPVITAWLQNNTIFGSYYTSGNSTPIQMTVLANCQKVQYSTASVYVSTRGIPTYPTGIFTGDGNRNLAGDQNAIYKLPLNPIVNTGTKTATSAGNCGVFINGVSLFDYRDGVAWNNTTGTICGGPGNPTCPGGMGATQAWNRDAIPAEKLGFDCAKGHPAGTNYHHHQNPSAFKYDSKTSISYSSICDLYNSDALYVINKTAHSPLLGFAYDGFPIYGAYAYTNTDGTGAITRMKSSYQLKNHTTRTNGPTVGQVVGTQTFFNGYFREDYEFVARTGQSDYLDVHNGRICNTPEYPKSLYPNGIYCYFATVDDNNTSVYPYVIGPTYYGVVSAAKVTSITETVTTYTKTTPTAEANLDNLQIHISPNPSADLIAIQVGDLVKEEYKVELYDVLGKLIMSTRINPGSTIAYFDTQTLYGGTYLIKISNGTAQTTRKVAVTK